MTARAFLDKHPQVAEALEQLVRRAKLAGTPADDVITEWHQWLMTHVSPKATRDIAINLFIA